MTRGVARGVAGPGFRLAPEDIPDPDEVSVAERRRLLALGLAIEATSSGTTPEKVVAAAGAFEAYMIGGIHPAPITITTPDDVLIDFLRAVRDRVVRTHNSGVIEVSATDTLPAAEVASAVARTAERAGLATEGTGGLRLWQLTGRGREAADRGML